MSRSLDMKAETVRDLGKLCQHHQRLNAKAQAAYPKLGSIIRSLVWFDQNRDTDGTIIIIIIILFAHKMQC